MSKKAFQQVFDNLKLISVKTKDFKLLFHVFLFWHEELNLGQECGSPLFRKKKNYQNLSGSCDKTHTKKAERETKGERGVNFDTFVGPTST